MPQLPSSPRAERTPLREQIKSKLSFFGMVGGVMAMLKFKERWDACEFSFAQLQLELRTDVK